VRVRDHRKTCMDTFGGLHFIVGRFQASNTNMSLIIFSILRLDIILIHI
jgi:hypothetical protein